MTRNERNFLNDVKRAVNCWDYSSGYYYEDGGFIVEISIDDSDEWAENESDIWDALSKVADDWDACLDSEFSTYYISIAAD